MQLSPFDIVQLSQRPGTARACLLSRFKSAGTDSANCYGWTKKVIKATLKPINSKGCYELGGGGEETHNRNKTVPVLFQVECNTTDKRRKSTSQKKVVRVPLP